MKVLVTLLRRWRARLASSSPEAGTDSAETARFLATIRFPCC